MLQNIPIWLLGVVVVIGIAIFAFCLAMILMEREKGKINQASQNQAQASAEMGTRLEDVSAAIDALRGEISAVTESVGARLDFSLNDVKKLIQTAAKAANSSADLKPLLEQIQKAIAAIPTTHPQPENVAPLIEALSQKLSSIPKPQPQESTLPVLQLLSQKMSLLVDEVEGLKIETASFNKELAKVRASQAIPTGRQAPRAPRPGVIDPGFEKTIRIEPSEGDDPSIGQIK